MTSISTQGPTLRRVDITQLVRQQQAQSQANNGPDLASLDPRVLTPVTGMLSNRLLNGLRFNFDDQGQSVSGQELSQYLASQGFSPQEIATALFSLHVARRTPGEDNMIHLNMSDLRTRARDTRNQSRLASVIMQMQKSKKPDALVNAGRNNETAGPLPMHNPHAQAAPAISPEVVASAEQEENQVHNLGGLLSLCLGGYTDRATTDAAVRELNLLGGNNV